MPDIPLMTLRIVPADGSPSSKPALMLCDGTGGPLANVLSLGTSAGASDQCTITVTMAVDGDVLAWQP